MKPEQIKLFKDKYEKEFDQALTEGNRKKASKIFREFQEEANKLK